MSLIQVAGLTFWRLGCTGRNGRGKTTFLNLLLGRYEYSGTISSNVNFEYFPFTVMNPEDNTQEVIERIYPECLLWQVRRELPLLQVAEDALYRPFSTLSHGEQTKVLLSAMFFKDNSFLLIDEPTNHLDMQARMPVSDYLKSKQGFILVSHDRSFLDNCIDPILAINKTNIEIQQGNFSSWWENKKRHDNLELAANEKLHKDIERLSLAAKRTSQWSDIVEKSKAGNEYAEAKPDRGYIDWS